MRQDVYRTQARATEREKRDATSVEDFVLPILFFLVGLLLSGTAVVGGPGHNSEAGLGVVSVIFASWIFAQALRTSRRGRDR